MSTLNGTATFSRPSYTDADKQRIALKLRDAKSATEFLEVEFSYPEFVTALFSGMGACDLSFFHLERVGQVHQHKTEIVPFSRPMTREHARETEDRALSPFEVDGWVANRSDLYNHHRRQKQGDYQLVSFHRYVDEQTGAPVKQIKERPLKAAIETARRIVDKHDADWPEASPYVAVHVSVLLALLGAVEGGTVCSAT